MFRLNTAFNKTPISSSEGSVRHQSDKHTYLGMIFNVYADMLKSFENSLNFSPRMTVVSTPVSDSQTIWLVPTTSAVNFLERILLNI